MKRYYYETPELSSKWRVFDRLRGSPDRYASRDSRAVALCDRKDDAEMIVDALNSRVGAVDSVDR